MQFQLSFCSPTPYKPSSCQHYKPRITVSATMTRPQDPVSATSSMYDLLGVREKAGYEEIKAAYRRQARQWHPDVCMSTDDKRLFAQRFMMARQAYDVLSDPERRRSYDSLLFRKGSGALQDCCRFGDWESQLEGLKNRSGGESWGSRMRKTNRPF